jgi:hypothetical protein
LYTKAGFKRLNLKMIKRLFVFLIAKHGIFYRNLWHDTHQ